MIPVSPLSLDRTTPKPARGACRPELWFLAAATVMLGCGPGLPAGGDDAGDTTTANESSAATSEGTDSESGGTEGSSAATTSASETGEFDTSSESTSGTDSEGDDGDCECPCGEFEICFECICVYDPQCYNYENSTLPHIDCPEPSLCDMPECVPIEAIEAECDMPLLTQGATIAVGDSNRGLAFGEMNGQVGDELIVLAGNVLRVYTGADWQLLNTTNVESWSDDLALGDFNGDGVADAAYRGPDSTIHVYAGAADGSFTSLGVLSDVGQDFVVLDLEGDGRDEIFSVASYYAWNDAEFVASASPFEFGGPELPLPYEHDGSPGDELAQSWRLLDPALATSFELVGTYDWPDGPPRMVRSRAATVGQPDQLFQVQSSSTWSSVLPIGLDPTEFSAQVQPFVAVSVPLNWPIASRFFSEDQALIIGSWSFDPVIHALDLDNQCIGKLVDIQDAATSPPAFVVGKAPDGGNQLAVAMNGGGLITQFLPP